MKARKTISWRIAGHSLPNYPWRGGALCRPREAIAMARKSNHEDEFGGRGVEFAMANWDMQRTRSYAEHGRQFENATDEDLQALFIQMFRIWGADPWWEGRSRLDDVHAEYKLRGVEPPFALVKDDFDKVLSAADDSFELMDPAKRAEIGSELVEEYLAAQKSRN
jgi:hypothetical protein